MNQFLDIEYIIHIIAHCYPGTLSKPYVMSYPSFYARLEFKFEDFFILMFLIFEAFV